jgi:Predicted flavoproteins
VLFTQKGLSGPAVLDLSRDVEPGDLLRVAVVSGMNGASVERHLLAQAANRGRRTVARAIQEMGIPLGLARALMEALGISATHMAELSRSERRALVDALALGYPFPLVGTAGWEEAMVTRGGVALAEVSSKTMEVGSCQAFSSLARFWISTGKAADITCRPLFPRVSWPENPRQKRQKPWNNDFAKIGPGLAVGNLCAFI